MAGEIESLDTEEPLVRHVERHNYDRLIMLSDGIFAIAATLLALEVQPPERWDGNFWHLIVQEWRVLFGYVFGFVVVATFWMAHRNIFARLRRVDTPATLLTLLLLCLVALVPAAAALIADFGPTRAILVYFTLSAGIALVQLVLWWWAAYHRRLTHPELKPHQRRAVLFQTAVFLFTSLAIALVIGSGTSDNSVFIIALLPALIFAARRRLVQQPGE